MITEALARFVIETKAGDIPDEVLVGARDALTDVLGVALAGTLEPAAEIATRWLQDLGARPQATFWGHNLATSAAEAAFANGICSHALDFDDSHPSLRGHPNTTMMPAALAVGEVAAASGEEVLAACALGLEIAGKLGRAFGQGHILRGWHITATIGALSSTAVAARLWGLDRNGLQRAWGLAASQMSGLLRNFGTMTKPFHAGHAARCGVLSAWMARHGLTADNAIFDGKGGVLETYRGEDGEAPAELIDRLGQPWEMSEPGIYVKRWPCCYSNHRAVGGLFTLIEKHGLHADEITEVAIGFLPGSDASLISHEPTTGLEGKFSIEYVMAATLLDRKLTLETFTDAMLQRPQARELMRKVRRYPIADDKLYSGISGYTDVAVQTTRGRFDMRVDRVPGSPEWPMTEKDRVEKFMDCAARALGAPGAEHLLELCQCCRTLPDIHVLVQATVPVADRPRQKRAAHVLK
ncbi:MAG: MmgE/PrpD family protein [Betaproteobacteria bacterium]|nr:MmgE/PrpD family protein [Betaproteobacteria bacterium]